MRVTSFAATAALAIVTLAQFAAPEADAQPRRRAGDQGYVYVTAESRYSSATITAPVRAGHKGRLEVRLPGGTWVECRQSCSDTLRRETIDFWYSRDRFGTQDGPGYLRFGF
jgi:hypothetical protein